MKNQLLNEASKIMEERGKVYGDYKTNLQHAAAIASMINGKHFTSYDVATIMLGIKFARIRETPTHHDSWVDAINYLVMAERLSNSNVENEVIELALKRTANDIASSISS
jgi:Domain of unknown function (DUF6378)